MKIIIDADACPRSVLKICLALGLEYNVPVWTVASFNHEIASDNHIIVGNNSQEADLKIMNLTVASDIVITQDWGLAAIILGRNAYVLSPLGREYLADKIQFLLEERETKAKIRRAGGRTKGPKKRTTDDDRNFYSALQGVIIKARNNINKTIE